MGAIRPQTPNQDVGWSQWARTARLTPHLTHCSWPQNPSTWLAGPQDTTWAVTRKELIAGSCEIEDLANGFIPVLGTCGPASLAPTL